MGYLHGVNTTEKETQTLTITDADLSNVVVIGTSPVHLIDEPKTINKITSYNYKSLIGPNIDGFTIPDAVQTILDESGGASIYTINIFDKDKHTASVDKSLTFTDYKAVLSEVGIYDLVLKSGETTLTLDVDYSFDDKTGEIEALEDGAIYSDTSNVTASYNYADFTKIKDSDVIGEVDENGKRTGAQAIYDIIGDYGVTPRIIIAPGFISKNVRTALLTIAEKIKGFCYFDGGSDLNVNLIEKARTKETDGVNLTETSERAMIFAPYVKRYNSYLDTTKLKPYSPVLAGQRVYLDRTRSVSKSIDNTATSTTTALEFPVSFVLDDETTDSNRINSTGVGTIINYKGEYRTWGGRNTSYPSKTGIKTFEAARRALDLVELSIQDSSFTLVGEIVSRAFIDNIVQTINDKFAAWANQSDPVVLDGEAWYDEELNTADDLANGYVRISYKCCPPPVAEHIEYQAYVDIKIITKALGA